MIAIEVLEEALAKAPAGSWQAGLTTFGTVVNVIQAAEGALRRSGLHKSADDLQRVLTAFFARQRQTSPIQGNAPDQLPPVATIPDGGSEVGEKRRPVHRRRHRIPGVGLNLG